MKKVYIIFECVYINYSYGYSSNIYCVVDSKEKAEMILKEKNAQYDKRYQYYEYEEFEVE